MSGRFRNKARSELFSSIRRRRVLPASAGLTARHSWRSANERIKVDLTPPSKAPTLLACLRNWRAREMGPNSQPETARPSEFGGFMTPPWHLD
jgi:hypothetical protein